MKTTIIRTAAVLVMLSMTATPLVPVFAQVATDSQAAGTPTSTTGTVPPPQSVEAAAPVPSSQPATTQASANPFSAAVDPAAAPAPSATPPADKPSAPPPESPLSPTSGEPYVVE